MKNTYYLTGDPDISDGRVGVMPLRVVEGLFDETSFKSELKGEFFKQSEPMTEEEFEKWEEENYYTNASAGLLSEKGLQSLIEQENDLNLIPNFRIAKGSKILTEDETEELMKRVRKGASISLLLKNTLGELLKLSYKGLKGAEGETLKYTITPTGTLEEDDGVTVNGKFHAVSTDKEVTFEEVLGDTGEISLEWKAGNLDGDPYESYTLTIEIL